MLACEACGPRVDLRTAITHFPRRFSLIPTDRPNKTPPHQVQMGAEAATRLVFDLQESTLVGEKEREQSHAPCIPRASLSGARRSTRKLTVRFRTNVARAKCSTRMPRRYFKNHNRPLHPYIHVGLCDLHLSIRNPGQLLIN